MSQPPPLPGQKRRFAGCGCIAAIAAFLMVIAGICVALVFYIQFWAGTGKNGVQSSIPADFVGVWECTEGPEQGTIRIEANGSAQCDIHGKGYNYSINPGRASFDPATKKLSIKLFFFIGPSWTVNEYPHSVNGQTQFTIDHHVFRRVGRLPNDESTIGV